MTDTTQNSTSDQWTSMQAYTLAVVCLLVGIAGGWFIRGSAPAGASVESASASAPADSGSQPSDARMKQMAETQAAPLIEKLKSSPEDATLLAQIGNVYYDAQQYPAAIEYYQRSLKIAPQDTSVRTDMGTAQWYTGNADAAIEQFNLALKYEPTKANTLFNLGIVKWQAKMDVDGAVEAWQKLLAANPNYEAKDKVQQLLDQVKKHKNVKPGTPGKALSE